LFYLSDLRHLTAGEFTHHGPQFTCHGPLDLNEVDC
jgi:hypothetical protein